jgi:hypothetical protein
MLLWWVNIQKLILCKELILKAITSVMTYGQAETKKVVFKTPDGGKIWDCSASAGTDIDLKWRLRHVNKSLQIVPSFCCN